MQQADRWEWLGEDGWHAYDAAIQAALSASIEARLSRVLVRVGERELEWDLEASTQTDSGRRIAMRVVRAGPVPSASAQVCRPQELAIQGLVPADVASVRFHCVHPSRPASVRPFCTALQLVALDGVLDDAPLPCGFSVSTRRVPSESPPSVLLQASMRVLPSEFAPDGGHSHHPASSQAPGNVTADAQRTKEPCR
jgi:hypothetical protein